MIIKRVVINNFKSIYGTQEFDFEDLTGLIKLSGVIGTGKTTLGESILYGLFGNVKGQGHGSLISWYTKGETSVQLTLTSNNKEIYINRNINAPLEVTVDGKPLIGSNKRDLQSILEEEYYDVPRMVVERMCIISFNQFKSLANMSPGDTKIFLDDVFGFNVFTEYNNIVVDERKDKMVEQTKLQANYDDACANINYFIEQKEIKQRELLNQVNIDDVKSESDKLSKAMQEIVDDMNEHKKQKEESEKEYKSKISEIDSDIYSHKLKINEYSILGKQEKDWYNKFKSGICPTCGHSIDEDLITEHKSKMLDYADKINAENVEISKLELLKNDNKQKIQDIETDFNNYRNKRSTEYNELKDKLSVCSQKIIKYNASLTIINKNYDQMICDYENKKNECKDALNKLYSDIEDWNEMNELFAKTFRYNLLNSIIPMINKSIQQYINKFELVYNVEFDQEFKAHIYAYGMENEINYSSLSTGQKKTLDIAIILGILQNIISNVNFNVLFCDELFSNMDINSRNTMLQVLKESNDKNRTIFIVNHSEMGDDAFSHKLRVELVQKKITDKKKNTHIVRSSKYSKIF